MSARLPDDQYQEMRAAVAKIPADDQSLIAEFARGAVMSHREWLRADFARQGLKQQWRALFRDFDVVICPPAATQPFRTIIRRPRKRGSSLSTARNFPISINWPGPNSPRPAACRRPSFPWASRTGLPIGVQIIGPEFEDRTPLAFARAGRARVRRLHAAARLRIGAHERALSTTLRPSSSCPGFRIWLHPRPKSAQDLGAPPYFTASTAGSST